MCSCDAEMPEFINQTKPVARKPYRCCECSGEISVGSRYARSNGKWDGEMRSYKTCLQCREVWAQLLRELPDCCCVFGGLNEEIYELDLIEYADDSDEITCLVPWLHWTKKDGFSIVVLGEKAA